MKKLLITLILLLTASCAWDITPRQKYRSGPLPSTPSQEEIAKKARFSAEVAVFNLWWAKERFMVEEWVSERAGVNVKLEIKEVEFTSNYRAGIMHVITVSTIEDVNMYITITKLIDKWEVKSLIIGNATETIIKEKSEEIL